MRKIWILLAGFTLLAGSTPLSAQNAKDIQHAQVIWFDVFENIKFGDKWQLQTEATERFFLDPAEQWQWGVRAYGIYSLNEGWSMGPGFSVWFPYVHSADITTHELRVAQQFLYRQKMEKRNRIGLAHRFKVEERFTRNTSGTELADDYQFALRFRYRLAFEYTLAKLGEKELPLKLYVNDEVFLQANKKQVNIFDQNRFNIGITVPVAQSASISVGYINVFRQRSVNQFEDGHTLRLYFTHELQVRRK